MGIPEHLQGRQARGLVENEVIAQWEIGPARNFVYLVMDWAQKKAAIVDPQKDLTEPLGALQRHGFTLTHVLLTHTHWDHVAGVPELLQRFPHLPIVGHPRDRHRMPEVRFSDDENVLVGSIPVEMIHTPGHSAGGCCYRLPGYLLTGDTLFIRDCGRTDLETGSTTEMFDSLQRIKALPADLVILPGHHYAPEVASILRKELDESMPLKVTSVQELQTLP